MELAEIQKVQSAQELIESLEAWQILATSFSDVQSLERLNRQVVSIAEQLVAIQPRDQEAIDKALLLLNEVIESENVQKILEEYKHHVNLQGNIALAQAELREQARRNDLDNVLRLETEAGKIAASILFGQEFYGSEVIVTEERLAQLEEQILPFQAMKILFPHASQGIRLSPKFLIKTIF